MGRDGTTRKYRRAPTAARACDDEYYDWTSSKPTIEVYETEDLWRATGLLDADGVPMQAWYGPDPIGFVHFDD